MLFAHDVDTLRRAADDYDVPLPTACIDADELTAAADTLLAAVRAETLPNIDQLTTANIKQLHERLSRKDDHALREQAATRIRNEAGSRQLAAWGGACTGFMAAFGAHFDAAADRFRTALEALDGNLDAGYAVRAKRHEQHQQLTDAAAQLRDLATVRNTLAVALPSDTGHAELDKLGRVLTLPDVDTLVRRLPIRVGGQCRYELDWWATVTDAPGVEIKWHAPAEQQTYRQLTLARTAA